MKVGFMYTLVAVTLCAIVWMMQCRYCNEHGGHMTYSVANGRVMCLTADGRVVE